MSRHASSHSVVPASSSLQRRALLVCPSVLYFSGTAAARAGWLQQTDPFSRIFREALEAPDFQSADEAWSKAISLKPGNAAAWSNRGTKRLQAGRWREAREDLQKALALEASQSVEHEPSSMVLNNLGNAEGALGDWTEARQHFLTAAQDPDPGLSAMYQLNYSLGAFQEGDAQAAVQGARGILRRDPFFLDARAALTAFLWGKGERDEAEGEWEALQQSGDGFGSSMYNKQDAVERLGIYQHMPAWAHQMQRVDSPYKDA
ncbi:hypothetical protein WJX84_010853 [Apatococcus fuscideae]|uniref:Uncharacterized protein n=1 Tax=Apatococcus fuscideae TaxID=2026836 RepID=A0AAW1T2M7_9CHLO